MKKNPCR